MDGLLVDSEPLWQEAEIICFETEGVKLSREMCRETMGLRVDEAVAFWIDRYNMNWLSPESFSLKVLDKVEELIRAKASVLPGVIDLLELLQSKEFTLALASSSPYRTIHTVLESVGIRKYFSVIHSAEDEKGGKPDPAVYLSTMKKMGAEPVECIAFEDSINGMRSALAAGAFTVVVPDPEIFDDDRFDEAHLKVPNLKAFSLSDIL